MKKFIIGTVSAVAVILVLLILFFASVYTVHVNQVAIVVRLGKAQTVTTSTGLHLHTPFIEDTVKVYTGDMLYDIPASDVITADKKSMIADNYVIWSVVDPVKYYQTLGAVQNRAEERIEAAVYNATKNTISSMKQDEIIAARGNTLTNLITTASNSDISQYGLSIELAEIKALDLPSDNKAAVYERMISERNNIAAGYTAQGNADAQRIRNDTDRQTSIIIADAEASAAILRAEGEAEYMRILSDAYNDPDKAQFYNFVRGLDSLEALANGDSTIILDKDSEYARILYGQN
ncbi:MAG: protease modulator HflC [Clostridiales bacterium]|nr:protease modulator HflC [Clostridiales bacterium]